MDREKLAFAVKLNRVLSWILVALSATMVLSGYGSTKLLLERVVATDLHLLVDPLFVGLLALHFSLSVVVIRFNWKSTLENLWKGRGRSPLGLRLIQRMSGWGILIAALLVVLSGLSWYRLGFGQFLSFPEHLRFDLVLILMIVVHAGVGARNALARRGVRHPLRSISILAVTGFALVAVVTLDTYTPRVGLVTGNPPRPPPGTHPDPSQGNPPGTPPDNGTTPLPATAPTMIGSASVGGEVFTFNPVDVETLRPDVFNPGFFSMFDILAYLGEEGQVDLEYHFEDSMNTYVIDSLNQKTSWWYSAYYDGGLPEYNPFRMEHYPWKDKAALSFFTVDPAELEPIYAKFRADTSRSRDATGTFVVPKVYLRGPTVVKEFTNVEVTPHNLRNDMFRENVTTAIDVKLSLGDKGRSAIASTGTKALAPRGL